MDWLGADQFGRFYEMELIKEKGWIVFGRLIDGARVCARVDDAAAIANCLVLIVLYRNIKSVILRSVMNVPFMCVAFAGTMENVKESPLFIEKQF